MTAIQPDYSKRDCSLPPGCKDLIDVIKRKGGSDRQTPKKASALPLSISAEHVFVNGRIRAREVVVCDEHGVVLGVFSLGDALSMAQRRELDLVLMDAKAAPPVCVIIDYGKYRYQHAKRLRKNAG